MRREHVYVGGHISQYAPLNYIESTYSAEEIIQSDIQYIDTQYSIPSDYIKVQCEVAYLRHLAPLQEGIIGARNNSGGFVMNWGYYNKMRLYNGTSYLDNSLILQINTLYDIEAVCNGSTQSIKVNGVTSSATSSSLLPLTSPYNLYLFCSNRGSLTNPSTMRMYKLKIYEQNNVCVRDFKPMLRLADSKPGMMDLQNMVFYTQGNPTAAEFAYG